MLELAIKKFNNIRKSKVLSNSLYHTSKKYAFIGVGMHSLTNLYALLHHFGIRLKWICTASSDYSREMFKLFTDCQFTHDINDIVADGEVEGVFVCSSPSSHFEILSSLLVSGKKIFVEKPPCQTVSELKRLIDLSKNTSICKVGLQRRYWPGNKTFVKKISSAKSYNYTFHFGNYIQGDPYTELFIHALDYCSHLFGDYIVKASQRFSYDKGLTTHLLTEHTNGIKGIMELSTHYSWDDPTDIIHVNCVNEAFTIQYPQLVKGTQKPKGMLGVPLERIWTMPKVTKEYFSTKNLILPVPETNTLLIHGFYNEIKAFIELVEKESSKTDQNDLPGLLKVFEAIAQLKGNSA
jgi:virulence factor